MTASARLLRASPYSISALRIVAGGLFFLHGTAKLFAVPHLAMFDSVAPMSLLWWAGVIETVGGAFLFLGLFTRLFAFILCGQMAFAYFIAHAPTGPLPILNGGEGAVLFCFIFLHLIFAGPGLVSLDAALFGRKIAVIPHEVMPVAIATPARSEPGLPPRP